MPRVPYPQQLAVSSSFHHHFLSRAAQRRNVAKDTKPLINVTVEVYHLGCGLVKKMGVQQYKILCVFKINRPEVLNLGLTAVPPGLSRRVAHADGRETVDLSGTPVA